MSSHQPEDSFDDLLERFCIDGLADDEWLQLSARIAADEDAMRRYVEAAHWRQSLGDLVGGGAASDHPSLSFADESVAGDPTSSTSSQRTGGSDSPARHEARQSTAGRFGRFFGPWALAVSTAFLAGAGITAIAVHWGAEPPRSQIAEAQRNTPSLVSVQPAPFIQDSELGKVSGLSLEASADGLLRSLQVGQELRCGEVVQLTRGFMRVTLHSGPDLIIEGPAEFSIIGKDSVFVRVGHVTANRAERLLLQSPLLTAECNDADVLFVAEEDTSTNVFAYKGVVTMRSIAHQGAGQGKLAVLHEGQGLLVGPDGTPAERSQVATVPPAGGVRSWAEVEAKLNELQRLVLSDRPVAYWPLRHVRRNRRVLDLTQHGFDGQAIGNWPAELNEANPLDEQGAFFNGECYIEPDRKPPINVRNGFTVEGWAKVTGGPAFQSIFTSRWVLDTHTPHRQCLGFTLYAGENDRWQFWTGNGRYGELWNELHTEVALVRHQWTHVVATFEPEPADSMPGESVKGAVRIYVDGELAAHGVHEISVMDFAWPARIGAAEFVPNSLTAWLFRGSLQNVAVYDYPLESARIRSHYEAGKQAG